MRTCCEVMLIEVAGAEMPCGSASEHSETQNRGVEEDSGDKSRYKGVHGMIQCLGEALVGFQCELGYLCPSKDKRNGIVH